MTKKKNIFPVFLQFPYPPASGNHRNGYGKGRVFPTKKYREWKKTCKQLAETQKWPSVKDNPVEIDVILFPPDRRKRDYGNAMKVIEDMLTYVNVWDDDSQIQRSTVEWGESIKGGLVDIVIKPYDESKKLTEPRTIENVQKEYYNSLQLSDLIDFVKKL